MFLNFGLLEVSSIVTIFSTKVVGASWMSDHYRCSSRIGCCSFGVSGYYADGQYRETPSSHGTISNPRMVHAW